MKKSLLTGVVCLLASGSVLAGEPFKYDYKIEGRVSGIVVHPYETWKCYVAVNAKDRNSRSHYYHAVAQERMCDLARTALFTGQNLILWGKVDPGNNIAVALEVTSDEVKWWDPPTKIKGEL